MILPLEFGKCLQQFGFLEQADAEDLRDGVEAVVELHAQLRENGSSRIHGWNPPRIREKLAWEANASSNRFHPFSSLKPSPGKVYA